MPKSNLCKNVKNEQRENAFREMTKGKLAVDGMDLHILSRKTGLSERTLYERIKDPSNMRLKELWAIVDALKPEDFYLQRMY